MAIKDYFKSFSYGSSDEIEYIIVFKHVSKPNIKDFPNLCELGRWNYYSEHGLSLFCKLSKDKFINMLSEETGISKDNFSVIRRNEFLGVGY